MNVKIWPRQRKEKGGILLMPLKKNIPNGRAGWSLVKCPKCVGECWYTPEMDNLVKEQGVTLLCTECGLWSGM